ncbi:His-Cys box homing endonuclease [Fusarium albosuccineum]|uniref:His-Cys box homing endonuclease n=1 Tax=Fusarium albosuccineum TaxID=1237068 RepID=A0A8H4PH78_9HYPO|nr:His-Cys box homing endonuclease [Fusarium albosuccineum]
MPRRSNRLAGRPASSLQPENNASLSTPPQAQWPVLAVKTSTVLPPTVVSSQPLNLTPRLTVTPADDSRTLAELRLLSPAVAQRTWERLRDGYADYKSGLHCPAAIQTSAGRLLAQKAPNRPQHGYIQIAPIVENGQARKTKPLPQNAHRLAVIAWHDEEPRAHLLQDGWHASHLCGNTLCIELTHIAQVESRFYRQTPKRAH